MVERRSSKKTTQLGYKEEDQNPRKLYSRFLFKALILAVFCSIVPVFLSQTPELANQTRLLELLHLVLVGIAVSYGLFSRRNYDGGGSSSSNDHKGDHYNTNVPKILEVSSVFNVDRESESETSDDSSGDRRQIQTWRNKYHMKNPEVVLSKDHETRFVDRVSSGVREKPLLLPVRTLNHSRVSDSGDHSGRWEKVRSKRQLLKSLGDEKSDVLPSPIPWRSRSSSSSSMEIETQPSVKNLATVELQPLIKTQANPTSSSSFSSSPRKSTPLSKLTSESGGKSAEDTVRREEFHPSPSPPPPPPPPPLPAFYNSASRKDHPPRTYRIESRESAQKKKSAGGEFHPPPPPPPPPPMDYYKSPPTKVRVSSERRKSSEQMKLDDHSAKRNSSTKVWWSDPIVELKEHRVIREDLEKNDPRSFLGSKATEEFEDNKHRRTENEIQEDDEHSDIAENKLDEEGVCGNNSDVDKKADEFIAKFREQIRLQRIESIKRSTNKFSANSLR